MSIILQIGIEYAICAAGGAIILSCCANARRNSMSATQRWQRTWPTAPVTPAMAMVGLLRTSVAMPRRSAMSCTKCGQARALPRKNDKATTCCRGSTGSGRCAAAVCGGVRASGTARTRVATLSWNSLSLGKGRSLEPPCTSTTAFTASNTAMSPNVNCCAGQSGAGRAHPATLP